MVVYLHGKQEMMVRIRLTAFRFIGAYSSQVKEDRLRICWLVLRGFESHRTYFNQLSMCPSGQKKQAKTLCLVLRRFESPHAYLAMLVKSGPRRSPGKRVHL